ncbi:hypothetical protein [Commensalibacter nepenthis]|uniref:Uncharacterized protein n=1 Tax=Commensalibacter nepenthis TaxID=3043872 RepID=A0ABT6Q6G0_9PROT|nr:hypothetical protein [Commensalibacter sp. TBRC 10068]MDI2112478.1 hypothetical protein [Commensalibacter sp. TBRC 10068]
MPMSDREYVNFSENHELNHILKKHGKSQSQKDREELKKLGVTAKAKLEKKILKHNDFEPFVKDHLKYLD